MGLFLETEVKIDDRSDHTLWCEKYRPIKLDEYIGSETLKSNLSKYIESGDVPHMLLFSSSPGTGKTTAAKMISKSIDCDRLYINASEENKIDTVRDKIKSYASSTGFKSLKIAILDECLHEDTLVTVLRFGIEQKIEIKHLDQSVDLVKSLNIEKNIIEWRPFKLWDVGKRELIEIELENGEVVLCTEEHKWYVQNELGDFVKMKTKDIIENNIENIVTF